MKIIMFFTVLIVTSGPGEMMLFAQNDTSMYIIPEFEMGKVKMRDGRTDSALMDYNTVTQEMIFFQEGKMLALDDLDNIDTVYIGQRIFMPFGKVFYELLVKGPVSLFVQHKTNPVSGGSPSGYGGSTETGATTNYASLTNSVHNYKLKLPDQYHLIDATIFWVRWNNKFYKANSSAQIKKIFPEKAKEIKQFIKKNNIDTRKNEDLVRLIVKCNELVRR
jgi:hypothetical protein